MLYFVLAYFILLTFLSYKNFSWGLYIVVATLPAYLIRFSIGPLPTTLLEIGFFALLLGGLLTTSKAEIQKVQTKIFAHKKFFTLLLALFICSLIGVYTSTIGAAEPQTKMLEALGEWRAFFLEPMMLFLLLLLKKEQISIQKVTVSLFVSAVFVSTIAVIQKFTGSLFPPSIEGTYLFGRVTSLFTTANAIGLFTAPIIFLTLALEQKKKPWIALTSIGLLIILLANFFSQSQGAWIAIGVGVVMYIFLRGYKKIALSAVVVGIVASLLIPTLRSAILFEDRAGKNRVELWHHTIEYLTESPKQFVLGTGIRNFFDAIQKPFFNPNVLEALKYPHTLVLNFWTEIGLFGMISYLGILVSLIFFSCNIRDKKIKAAVVAAFVAFGIQGLVDVPYFKNDLAIAFWVLAFIAYAYYEDRSKKLIR